MDAPLDTHTLQALRHVPGPDGRPLLDHVIKLALEALPAAVEKLTQGLAKAEWETVRRAAHTLKGTSGSFGAKGLSRLAEALERAAQEGSAAQAGARLEEVLLEIERVMGALRSIQSS
jgi:two-component system sensor histidine kinase/response regulator